MNEFDKILNEYRDRFGEAFPLMLCRHMDDDEIITTVKKCLDDGEPYNPELDPEANY